MWVAWPHCSIGLGSGGAPSDPWARGGQVQGRFPGLVARLGPRSAQRPGQHARPVEGYAWGVHERLRGLVATGAALLFCLLWAGAYVGAKIALRDVPPLSLLTLRFLLAGLALVPLAVVCRSPWPSRSLWPPVIGLGLLSNAIYLGLAFEALQFTSAGLAAVIASTNPLLLAVIAPLVIAERPSRTTQLGLLLGFVGVVLVMLPRIGGGQDSALGAVIFVVALVALVGSTVLFKRQLVGAGLVAVTAGQLLAAAAAVAPFALLFERALPAVSLRPAGWLALLFLVLGVSVGGSLLWFWLLTHGEATRVSAWYFVVPVFGVVLGVLILGERFDPAELPGLGAVAPGIVLVNRPPPRPGEPAEELSSG